MTATIPEIEKDTEAITLAKLAFKIVENTGDKYTIENTQQNLAANDSLLRAKALLRAIEARRTSVVKPLNDAVDTINGWFMPKTKLLKNAIVVLGRAMAEYDEKLTAAAEAARLKILADQRTLPETKSEKLATIEKPPEVIESSMGKTTFRIDKKLHVAGLTKKDYAKGIMADEWLDNGVLPREYMIPDESKIFAALKEGIEIPGARIIEVKTPVSGRGNF